MSIQAHRDTDLRACGATTTSAQNKNVYVNGLLWAIDGDPNNHGGGAIDAKTKNVFIGGLMVSNLGDLAAPDNLCPIPGGPHCAPSTTSGSPDVFVGE